MKRNILIYLFLLLCSISVFAQGDIIPPRTCNVCKTTKPASAFSGDSKTCKACVKKTPKTRTCTSCKKTKALNAFSGDSKTCKACVEEARKEEERKRQEQLERERLERERIAREQAEKAEQERIALRDKVNGLIKMVYVEGGTFTMGATSEQGSDAYNDERPAHKVTLSGYSIGQTEVTQELWQAVMGSNPSYFKGAKLPVERVSWNDCQTFITKLNQLTGKKFRLPTEAEWEYAARGGGKNSKGYKYAGSNTVGDVAWYDGNSSSTTHEVATKQPNELGLYDMSGNVWEWCQDRYGSSYYSSSPQTNPTGPSSGSYRVLRGGGWNYYAGYCRVSHRSGNYPDNRFSHFGLRLAL